MRYEEKQNKMADIILIVSNNIKCEWIKQSHQNVQIVSLDLEKHDQLYAVQQKTHVKLKDINKMKLKS